MQGIALLVEELIDLDIVTGGGIRKVERRTAARFSSRFNPDTTRFASERACTISSGRSS